MKIGIGLLCLAFGAGSALASPIGLLGVGSSGYVEATLTSINWTADVSALGPGGPYNGDVNSATTLAFVGGPLAVTEGVLINQGFPLGTPPPANAGIYNPFMAFALHPNLQFTLTGVGPGSSNTNCASLAIGQSCSIDVAGTVSPVILTKLGPTSSSVALNLFGFVTDGSGQSSWSGAFSATIPNMTPLGIVQYFCGTDNTCSAGDVGAGKLLQVRSVSGSFEASASPVPEPGALSLMMIGLGAITMGRIRKSRRK